jgi:hypothetical protein
MEINENYQMAEKYYFKNQILSPIEQKLILEVSQKDSTTKFLCDVFIKHIRQEIEDNDETLNNDRTYRQILRDLTTVRQQVLDYKKTVFPIKGFDILDGTKINIYSLLKRAEIIEIMGFLPSVAYRNNTDKKIERDFTQMLDYLDKLTEFYEDWYNLIKFSDDEDTTNSKLFSAKNPTLDSWIEYMNNYKKSIKEDLHFENITKDTIDDLIKQSKSIKKIISVDDYMMLYVDNNPDIKLLGCHSKLCFSQKGLAKDDTAYWTAYSHKGAIFVLLDFTKNQTDSDFMFVFVKPFLDTRGNPTYSVSLDKWDLEEFILKGDAG